MANVQDKLPPTAFKEGRRGDIARKKNALKEIWKSLYWMLGWLKVVH